MFTDALYKHSLYDRLNNLNTVRIFMAGHVVSVYNFMILLKGLQKHYLQSKDPCSWHPTKNKHAIRAIAALIADEETDIITHPNHSQECLSHFEIYVKAMEETGASPDILNKILSHYSVPYKVDGPVCEFSEKFYADVKAYHDTILDVVESGDQLKILAFFHAGRETIIPGMFTKILDVLKKNDLENIEYFKWYLDRHIHIDGEVHSTILEQAIDEEIGTDSDARILFNKYAREAVIHRIELYNAIENEILSAHGGNKFADYDIAAIADISSVALSTADIAFIQSLINNPPEPNDKLKEAFRKHKQMIKK